MYGLDWIFARQAGGRARDASAEGERRQGKQKAMTTDSWATWLGILAGG